MSSIATAAPASPPPGCDPIATRPLGLTIPRALSLLLILFPTFLRILLIDDPFPIWDTSPFKFPAPSIGVPPTLALALNVMTILGAALALIVSGSRVRLIEPLLLLAGAIVATMHALFIDGGSLDNLRIGSGWTAALAAGIGIRQLASDLTVRRWIFALVLGASMPLAIQSLVQVYVEHPATVASYRTNPQAFLDAKGWTPGSAMARNYERRLMQPEASAWFGMSNVHATFAAAFVVGWMGVVIGPLLLKLARKPVSTAQRQKWKKATAEPSINHPMPIRGEPVLLAAMLAFAVAMLLLTRSKGGIAALLLGLALFAGAAILQHRANKSSLATSPKFARLSQLASHLLGSAVMLGVIALITLRGMIGTAIGELSLLFRWFYISAATRIFADQPLLGVGPADFRPAYELAKNPLSPEEVISPHSLPFDWLATLGIGGIAWLAIVVGWSIWLGISLMPQRATPSQSPAAPDPSEVTHPLMHRIGLAFLIITLACVTAFIIELGGYADVLPIGTTIRDIAIVISQSRLPGLILWILATALLLVRPMSDTLLRRTLGCIGLTLLASSCIDVAPVWPNSAALFFVMLGLAASEDVAPEDRPTWRERGAGMIGAGIVLTTAMPMLWAGPRVIKWEQELVQAGAQAHRVGSLSMRANLLEQGRPLVGDSESRWMSDYRELIGSDPAPQLREAVDRAIANSDAPGFNLEDALASSGIVHPQTLLAAADAELDRAQAWFGLGDSAEAASLAKRAADIGIEASECSPLSSSSFGSLGRAYLAAHFYQGPATTTDAESLAAAIAAFERAASLDPHGITYPLQLFELARQIGDRDLARKWAEELLRRNANMKLDPVRALTPEQISRAEAALRPSP